MIVGQESAEEPFGRKSDGNVLLGLAGGYPCRLSDRSQNSQCSLLLRPPGNRRERKIRSKRKTGGKRVALLQDNARSHTAKTTMETLRKLKWNLLTHPPYSPDLAPSDFYLFGGLKSDLQGMRFADNAAVIQTVREWIRRQPQAFFEKGIRMLPERWKKCVDSGGEYIED